MKIDKWRLKIQIKVMKPIINAVTIFKELEKALIN
jgi:hypothetical protein